MCKVMPGGSSGEYSVSYELHGRKAGEAVSDATIAHLKGTMALMEVNEQKSGCPATDAPFIFLAKPDAVHAVRRMARVLGG
mmetsp:Transcript_10137/g.33259  ORF Transcript_10137/g.33259 Transcript_10137/m.33259 type:complete len:81 (+) Transcript_10137:1702-1944(+)